ncbi:MAG TPA: isochorismatase family protein [Candidatus Sulfotelmatobacter sp.]|nr:isochorismatase family protein [Candidatus Sulfotelmatobacter sp.]
MPHTPPAPIASSALLVIDVQDSFKAGARWAQRGNPRFEDNLRRLLAAYRAAHLPVIFFLHSDEDEHFQTDSPAYRLMDFVQPLPGETLLHKTTRNCFTSTRLQQLLTQRGIRRLIVTGIQTEQCCETTARLGGDLGYDVDFVSEATLTFPIPLVPGRREGELPVEAVVERTEFALRRRFARIASVDDILAEVA